MTGRRRIGIGLSLLFAGCAARQVPTNDLPEREVLGHYTADAGGSWFRPCGAAEADPAWWVTFTGVSVEQAERERAAGRFSPGKRTFVRLRTAVATDGRVGPQGPGVPALLVRDILEVAEASAGDCDAKTDGNP
jgi:hypothetical protein